MARLVLFDTQELRPGGRAVAQLRLREPVVAGFDQRFIIRDETAVRTVGGGRVLRPVARRLSRRHAEDIAGLKNLLTGKPEERLAEVVRYSGFSMPSPEELSIRAGIDSAERVTELLAQLVSEGVMRRYAAGSDQVLVHRERVDRVFGRLRQALSRFHRDNPLAVGMNRSRVVDLLGRWGSQELAGQLLDEMMRNEEIIKRGQFCCLAEFSPTLKPETQAIQDSIVQEIGAGRFQPPVPNELAAAGKCNPALLSELLTLAVADGRLVAVNPQIYLAAEAYEELKETVRRLVAENGSLTVSELRAALDSTRKYVVPICEHLDSIRFTRRMGDKRVLADGPRT
jgi:selenocysteine-specific elongation factor